MVILWPRPYLSQEGDVAGSHSADCWALRSGASLEGGCGLAGPHPAGCRRVGGVDTTLVRDSWAWCWGQGGVLAEHIPSPHSGSGVSHYRWGIQAPFDVQSTAQS